MTDLPREVQTAYGYCGCGCGQKTRLARWNDRHKGWIRGEPLRYIAGHRTTPPRTDYRVDPDTGCWLWLGCKSPLGYGYVKRSGHRAAHRLYYTEHVGPIPDGLVLDHLCRNPSCVNPDHLEPVTNAENGRRGICSKLSHEAAAEIRASEENAYTLAERYGVHWGTIYSVRRGDSWSCS